MPYNLRKRKAPEPIVEAPKKVRKQKEPKKELEKEVQEDDKRDIEEDRSAVDDDQRKVDDDKKKVGGGRRKVTVKRTKVEDSKQKVEDSKKKVEDDKKKVEDDKKPVEDDKKPVEDDRIEVEEDNVEVKEELKVDKKEDKQDKIKPVISTECNLFIFGRDSCGELGLKKIGILKKTPTLVPIGTRVKQVACGPMHTIVLTTEGTIYSFGCNDEGALGRVTEDEDDEATPTLVQIDHKIIKISVGDSHSAALTEDKRVYVWGNFKDNHGSVGLLPECNGEKTYKPVQVMPDIEFKDIASGGNHMLLLDVSGIVYSFGVGDQGQLGRLRPEDLGVGDGKEVVTAAMTADNRELFLKPQPICLKNVDPNRPFICDAIYAGEFSSFATNTDKRKNRLAAWGLNNYHQLGYKGVKNQLIQYFPKRSTFTCSTSIVQVASGQHHTLFLTKAGKVCAAGRRDYGRLGLGEVKTETICPAVNINKLENSVTAIATGIATSFAVTNEGKLYSWGMFCPSLGSDKEEDLNHPTEVKRLEGKKVTSVSSGGDFTAVLIE